MHKKWALIIRGLANVSQNAKMKNTKIHIAGIIMLMILYSCGLNNRAKFEITNNSDYTIDSLTIRPDINSDQEFIKIEKGQTKIYWTDMNNIPQIDGDYLISYKFQENEIINKKRFGYYTNGYPIESVTKIKIMNDSLYFDFELKKY
jgi:hypothetical protein